MYYYRNFMLRQFMTRHMPQLKLK